MGSLDYVSPFASFGGRELSTNSWPQIRRKRKVKNSGSGLLFTHAERECQEFCVLEVACEFYGFVTGAW